jgi:hypothetical protein
MKVWVLQWGSQSGVAENVELYEVRKDALRRLMDLDSREGAWFLLELVSVRAALAEQMREGQA